MRGLVGRLIEDDGVLGGEDLTAEAREVGPVEDHQTLHEVALGENGVGAQPNRARRLTTADLRSIGLHLHNVEPHGRAGL